MRRRSQAASAMSASGAADRASRVAAEDVVSVFRATAAVVLARAAREVIRGTSRALHLLTERVDVGDVVDVTDIAHISPERDV